MLHITNIPTPYRLPLFREIGARARRRGLGFRVFFLGYAKSDRRWRIPPEEFDGIDHAMASRPSQYRIADAARAIRELRPSVVVLAWAMDPVALRLLLHCRLRSIPCVIVSGETPRSAAGNPHRLLRRIFRQPFFSLADGFITYGARSTEYLLESGVSPDRITTGINVVDTRFFATRTDELRVDGTAGRDRRGFATAAGGAFGCHLLFVGYLLPEKGCAALLDALARLGRRDIALHIVGAGPEEDALKERAGRLGVSGECFFHGYVQTEDLPRYYALADLLIFPSLEEVYGLVLAEGAAAGLPVIASMNAGGTADVVEDGVSGLVVDPADCAAMAGAIERLADDPELRRRMGEEARRRATELLTLGRSADRYLERIELASRSV